MKAANLEISSIKLQLADPKIATEQKAGLTTALQAKYTELQGEEVKVNAARESVQSKTTAAGMFGDIRSLAKLTEFNQASNNFTSSARESLDKERLEALTTLDTELKGCFTSLQGLVNPLVPNLEKFA